VLLACALPLRVSVCACIVRSIGYRSYNVAWRAGRRGIGHLTVLSCRCMCHLGRCCTPHHDGRSAFRRRGYAAPRSSAIHTVIVRHVFRRCAREVWLAPGTCAGAYVSGGPATGRGPRPGGRPRPRPCPRAAVELRSSLPASGARSGGSFTSRRAECAECFGVRSIVIASRRDSRTFDSRLETGRSRQIERGQLSF